jgi:hypothetical protein
MAGRKSLKEEIQVVRYMTELSPKVFKVIQEALEGEILSDKKWAVEQMMKLYVKAIPQEMTGDGGKPFIIQIAKEVAEKYSLDDTTQNTENNSGGQAQIQGS